MARQATSWSASGSGSVSVARTATARSCSRAIVPAVGLPFVAWTAALVVAGLRVTYRLAWFGMVSALALAAVFVAAFVALPLVL